MVGEIFLKLVSSIVGEIFLKLVSSVVGEIFLRGIFNNGGGGNVNKYR